MVQRFNVFHYCATFCADRSNHSWDRAIFHFFLKMAVVHHLGIVMCMFGPPAKSIFCNWD